MILLHKIDIWKYIGALHIQNIDNWTHPLRILLTEKSTRSTSMILYSYYLIFKFMRIPMRRFDNILSIFILKYLWRQLREKTHATHCDLKKINQNNFSLKLGSENQFLFIRLVVRMSDSVMISLTNIMLYVWPIFSYYNLTVLFRQNFSLRMSAYDTVKMPWCFRQMIN